VDKLYLSALGTTQTRAAIADAFARGSSLMSYVGHGGVNVWASENLLNDDDVTSFPPQAIQPLLMTMNCLNGYFWFPPLNSLSEQLLKAEGKGVVAAFSPTGLSVEAPAHIYQRALVNELVSGQHVRLGDVVLAAQQDYAQAGVFPELLELYHLFGDPAMPVQPSR
jgi:hypothetical protein